jgi:hypothetical protein
VSWTIAANASKKPTMPVAFAEATTNALRAHGRFRRGTAAESGSSSIFRRYVRLQHEVGAVVLVAIFTVLALDLIGG